MAPTLRSKTAPIIFADRDMGRWSSPSVQRKINLLGCSAGVADAAVQPDTTTGQPALLCEIDDAWVSPNVPWVEAWYDAAGLDIASVYYAWKQAGIAADTNWVWQLVAATDDVVTAFDTTGNLRATGPGSGTLMPSAGRKFAYIQFRYPVTPAGASGASFPMWWTCLAVYGNHGLTKRGSNTATDAQGFYTSDIAKWVAAQVPTVQAGNIPDATGYIVRHSAYYTPAPFQTMLADVAKLIGCHWGVWESLTRLTGDARPRLDFCPYPSAPTAWAYRKDCDSLDLNEQLANLYDTAIVSYTDTGGVQRSVTVTATNPMLQLAGISGRDIPVDGGTMTPASAQAFGQLILQLLMLQARVAGQATFKATVNTPGGGRIPAWLLKSGLDRLRIVDLPGSVGFGLYNDVPITRVETTGGEDGISTAVDLGTGADLTETLQAQLAEQATILGV